MATRRVGVIGCGAGGFFTAVGTSAGGFAAHAHPYAADRPAIETAVVTTGGMEPGAFDAHSSGSARCGAGRCP